MKNKMIGTSRHAISRGGFSLVELLLVLVILATLAAIVVPKFAGRSEQAKETAAQTDISAFEGALDAFEIDNGMYPATEDGLVVLVEQPSDLDDWRGPYVKSVPKDPWGQDYVYEYPGSYNDSYDIYSLGPDGKAGTEDDITNWEEED